VTEGRTARRTLLVALAASVPLFAVGAPAVADPVYPSQDDVDAARSAADATAAQVAALQTQLTGQQDQLEAAQTSLSVATEDYDEARALLEQRTAEASAATRAAADAAEVYEQARIAVGQLASQRYRGSSGEISPLSTVLASGSIADYVNGEATLDHLAVGRADVQADAAAAKLLAESTARAAADAEQAQQDATAATATAQQAAQRAADAADAMVADTRSKTDALVAQLAQLQQTSVELEQQRQAGLEAERQAAAAAAAKAAAEAAARAAAQAEAAAARSSSVASPRTPSRSASGSSARSAAGSSSSVRRAAGPTAGADTAVDWALAQLGKPYLWAGDGPDSFDCSGLTMRAWQAAGVSLPHSSRIQYSGEGKVDLADLEPGDLVFYATNTSNPSTIHHVGMVISSGTMVEAPHSGAQVRTASIYRSGLMPYGTRPA
jgi:cell wall-associated NlpC family hydrolase